MRLYYNHYHTEDLESTGYEYFTSKREAHKAFRFKERNGEGEGESTRARSISFKPSLKGVAELLNKVANHPNNG